MRSSSILPISAASLFAISQFSGSSNRHCWDCDSSGKSRPHAGIDRLSFRPQCPRRSAIPTNAPRSEPTRLQLGAFSIDNQHGCVQPSGYRLDRPYTTTIQYCCFDVFDGIGSAENASAWRLNQNHFRSVDPDAHSSLNPTSFCFDSSSA